MLALTLVNSVLHGHGHCVSYLTWWKAVSMLWPMMSFPYTAVSNHTDSRPWDAWLPLYHYFLCTMYVVLIWVRFPSVWCMAAKMSCSETVLYFCLCHWNIKKQSACIYIYIYIYIIYIYIYWLDRRFSATAERWFLLNYIRELVLSRRTNDNNGMLLIVSERAPRSPFTNKLSSGSPLVKQRQWVTIDTSVARGRNGASKSNVWIYKETRFARCKFHIFTVSARFTCRPHTCYIGAPDHTLFCIAHV